MSKDQFLFDLSRAIIQGMVNFGSGRKSDSGFIEVYMKQGFIIYLGLDLPGGSSATFTDNNICIVRQTTGVEGSKYHVPKALYESYNDRYDPVIRTSYFVPYAEIEYDFKFEKDLVQYVINKAMAMGMFLHAGPNTSNKDPLMECFRMHGLSLSYRFEKDNMKVFSIGRPDSEYTRLIVIDEKGMVTDNDRLKLVKRFYKRSMAMFV